MRPKNKFEFKENCLLSFLQIVITVQANCFFLVFALVLEFKENMWNASLESHFALHAWDPRA